MIQVGPHSFKPLRPWDLRSNGRCQGCLLPKLAHPVHCWVPARAWGDKRAAELTWESLHGKP